MTRSVTLADLPALAGTEIGTSDWIDIPQSRIDAFADSTGDHQWIHVDAARAADGPFGTTIAHGFLTLSLFVTLWTSLLEITDATTLLNYGLNRVRFTSPVPVDARLRLTATLAGVEPAGDGYQLTVDGVIEIEGQERPAVVLQFLSRVA